MDSRTNILSMLGLALRGHRLVVGEEPVEAVARARDARVLLLASDAADNTKRRCRHFAEAGQCLYLTLPFTKEELGQVTGRSSVAICALTDVGMAASFVHKLELLDPKTYADAAQRLDVKAKRAAERKAEMQAHEKNLRQGKCKKKPAPEKEAAPAEEPAPEKQERPRASRPFNRDGGKRPYGGPRREEGKRPYFGQRRTDWKPRPQGDGEQRSFDGKPDFRKSDRPYSGPKHSGKSRPSKENRPKPKARYNPYAHSLPVKKGKGSFRKKEG